MTAIAAVRKDDVIYMCADSQTSFGTGKTNYLGGINNKIHVLNGDTLFAGTGGVREIQTIISHPEWFDFDREEGLTKGAIINTCTKIFDYFKDNELFKNKPDELPTINASILIAWKDRLFEICEDLMVLEYRTMQTIGCGDSYMIYAMTHIDLDGDIERQLVDACKISERFTDGVSAPYILVNTRDLEVKVVED